jgi:hypothetical protein
MATVLHDIGNREALTPRTTTEETMDQPELIIYVYDGHGYPEQLRVLMEKSANAGGIQVPGYKATGLTLDPKAAPLLHEVSVAGVRGDEQGFHLFVIPQGL